MTSFLTTRVHSLPCQTHHVRVRRGFQPRCNPADRPACPQVPEVHSDGKSSASPLPPGTEPALCPPGNRPRSSVEELEVRSEELEWFSSNFSLLTSSFSLNTSPRSQRKMNFKSSIKISARPISSA